MLGGVGWIAGVECDCCGGAAGHGISHAEPQPVRCRLDTMGCLFGFGGPAGCEPAACEQFERSGPEYAGDERQVIASRRGGEYSDSASGVTGFDECGGECDGCCAAQALIEAVCQYMVLLGDGQCQLEIAGGERGE